MIIFKFIQTNVIVILIEPLISEIFNSSGRFNYTIKKYFIILFGHLLKEIGTDAILFNKMYQYHSSTITVLKVKQRHHE